MQKKKTVFLLFENKPDIIYATFDLFATGVCSRFGLTRFRPNPPAAAP